MSEGKQELATDRLLEVLRGNKSVDAVIEESTKKTVQSSQIGLSADEERALLDMAGPAKKEKPSSIPDIGKKFKIPGSLTLPKISFGFSGSIIPILKKYIQKIFLDKLGYIALDIGSASIKYIVFRKAGKKMIIDDCGMHVLPHRDEQPLSDAEIAQEIVTVLGKKRLENYHVISAVFGPRVAIKSVVMPKVGKNEMRDAILWNAKKDLPFEIEGAFMDYKLLGEVVEKGVDKLSLMVALAQKDAVDEHTDLLKLAEIQPFRTLPIPLAIFNTFMHIRTQDQEPTGIVIDIGASKSYVIFIVNGSILFAREISVGGNEITKSLLGTVNAHDKPIDITWEKAELYKQRYNLLDPNSVELSEDGIPLSQMCHLLAPSVEHLLTQVQRSIDYFHGKFAGVEPDIIYLTGGTAMLKGFDQYVHELLGKDVVVLNPFESAEMAPHLRGDQDIQQLGPLFSGAFGIGSDGGQGVNLFPDSIKMLPILDYQKRLLTIASGVIVIFLLIFTFMQWRHTSKEGLELSNVAVHKESIQQVNQTIQALQETRQSLLRDTQSFQQLVSQLDNNVDIVKILKVLSALTPEYISINSISVNAENASDITISGIVNSTGYQQELLLTKYTLSLSESGVFSQVAPYQPVTAAGETTGFPFSVTCTL